MQLSMISIRFFIEFICSKLLRWFKEIIAKSMELNNLLNVTVLETLLKPHVNHIRREMTSDGRKGFSLTSEIQKFIRSLENSL